MENILKEIVKLIAQGKPFVLATILDNHGSTPRVAGTKMIIRNDGTISGTIGGGLVEARVISVSKDLFVSGNNSIRHFSLNNTVKEGLDMVCGGSLTVLIETVDPGDGQNEIFAEAELEREKGRKCLLVYETVQEPDDTVALQKCLVKYDGAVTGVRFLAASELKNLYTTHFSNTATVLSEYGEKQIVIEPVCVMDTVFIIGAGHVSLKLSELTHFLEFKTIVMDDRAEFANEERFTLVDDVQVITDYNLLFDRYTIDSQSGIVIMTRGHLHDKEALSCALKTGAGYIGMIGSRRKRDTIYASLIEEGFTKEQLAQVKCPIGVSIDAETPAELAVSIAGELIAFRNRNRT